MVDPFNLEPAVKVIPGPGFIGHDRGALEDAGPYPGLRRAFGLEHGLQGAVTAFPDDHNHLAPAVPVLGKATVPAVFFAPFWAIDRRYANLRK